MLWSFNLILLLLMMLTSCGKGQSKAKLEISHGYVLSSSYFGGLIVTGKHSSGKQFSISIDSTFTKELLLDDGLWEFKAVAWDGNSGNFMGSPHCGANTIDLKPDTLSINISLSADCTTTPINMNPMQTFTCGTNQYVNGDTYSLITAAVPDTYCDRLPTSFQSTLTTFTHIKYVAMEIVNGVKTYPFESPCISSGAASGTKFIPINYIPLAIKAFTTNTNCTADISPTLFEFPAGINQGNSNFQSILHTSPYRLVLPTAATKQFTAPPAGPGWLKETYLNAVNADVGDIYGQQVAIHRDTMVVGTYREDSNQTTITNGNTASTVNAGTDLGAVYVYKRTGTNWVQEAYIKAANAESGDSFGYSISIHQGTLAVGALMEDSSDITITNGTTASVNNSATNSGAVYIYTRTGPNWVQEAYIKSGNANANDQFGSQVMVHADTLAVAAKNEGSNLTTITNGATASSDNSSSTSGAVYIYARSAGNWTQEAYIKAANNGAGDMFGTSLSLHQNTLAVAAQMEDSNQTTITNGSSASSDNTNTSSGAVYVYTRSAGSWSQQAYIKASNNGASDFFGSSVSIDHDRLAVGASAEDSNQLTITNGTGSSADNTITDSGAVYIYKRTGTAWAQEAYVKASNAGATHNFGYAVKLQGNTLVVASPAESSNQTISTTGSSTNNTNVNAGAVYVYKLINSIWVEEAYLKSHNNESGDLFGSSVAIFADTIVVGATQEDGLNNLLSNSGAVYVYRNISRLFEPMEVNFSVTASQITIGWESGGGSTSGHVVSHQLGTTPPADCSTGDGVPIASSHTITGLSTVTTYSVRVCATNGSMDSDGITFTVQTL